MSHKKWLSLALALLCVTGLYFYAAAAEVDCDSIYCFTAKDFSS